MTKVVIPDHVIEKMWATLKGPRYIRRNVVRSDHAGRLLTRNKNGFGSKGGYTGVLRARFSELRERLGKPGSRRRKRNTSAARIYSSQQRVLRLSAESPPDRLRVGVDPGAPIFKFRKIDSVQDVCYEVTHSGKAIGVVWKGNDSKWYTPTPGDLLGAAISNRTRQLAAESLLLAVTDAVAEVEVTRAE